MTKTLMYKIRAYLTYLFIKYAQVNESKSGRI
ncbi:hypothetical protein FHS70_002753 [Flammeovirga yaeyamensis]|nr:hypothetical protein [Flammeovirga yaeyamensis]